MFTEPLFMEDLGVLIGKEWQNKQWSNHTTNILKQLRGMDLMHIKMTKDMLSEKQVVKDFF